MRTKNEKSKITKALLETAHALAGRDEVPADQDVTRESYRSLSEAAQYFARKTAEEIRRLPTDLRLRRNEP